MTYQTHANKYIFQPMYQTGGGGGAGGLVVSPSPVQIQPWLPWRSMMNGFDIRAQLVMPQPVTHDHSMLGEVPGPCKVLEISWRAGSHWQCLAWPTDASPSSTSATPQQSTRMWSRRSSTRPDASLLSLTSLAIWWDPSRAALPYTMSKSTCRHVNNALALMTSYHILTSFSQQLSPLIHLFLLNISQIAW